MTSKCHDQYPLRSAMRRSPRRSVSLARYPRPRSRPDSRDHWRCGRRTGIHAELTGHHPASHTAACLPAALTLACDAADRRLSSVPGQIDNITTSSVTTARGQRFASAIALTPPTPVVTASFVTCQRWLSIGRPAGDYCDWESPRMFERDHWPGATWLCGHRQDDVTRARLLQHERPGDHVLRGTISPLNAADN